MKWEDRNTIDHGDAADGSEGGYDAHGNFIICDAMREIIELRKQLAKARHVLGIVRGAGLCDDNCHHAVCRKEKCRKWRGDEAVIAWHKEQAATGGEDGEG